MATDLIDPKTLMEKDIREAIIHHCTKMGSMGYYIEDEMRWYKAEPNGIRVLRDQDGRLRAWHVRDTEGR